MLRFEGCFTVNAMGRKGGLALLWRKQLHVRIINYYQWHISMQVEDEDQNLNSTLIGFYGEIQWVAIDTTPLMVIEDFNEILFQDEKVGEAAK